MGLWVLLATIYVLVTLGQARTQRLIPDQAAIPDASTTWHPRLVILLACTPPIAGFMGLSGGLIGLLTPQTSWRPPQNSWKSPRRKL